MASHTTNRVGFGEAGENKEGKGGVTKVLPFWEVVTLVGVPRHSDDPGIRLLRQKCREHDDVKYNRTGSHAGDSHTTGSQRCEVDAHFKKRFAGHS